MTIREMFTPTTLIFLIALAVVTIAGFLLIPADAILPTHWGLDGKVDGTMPRNLALLMAPGFTVLIWAIFYLLMRYGARARTEGGLHVLQVSRTGITGLFVTIQAAIVAVGLGVGIDMIRLISIAMALLLIGIGNAMPKSQPNSFAGLRIPSTMRDPANWQATHRVTGWLMIAGGLGLLLAALAAPTGLVLLCCLGAAVLLPLIVGTVYSISLGRRPA